MKSGAIKVDYRIGGLPRHYLSDPDRPLVKVPDKVRTCVAYLGYESAADGEILAGTAFFLALKDGGRNFLYLVSAGHVIEGMKSRGVAELFVRVNKRDGAIDRVFCEPRDWLFHPRGPVVDVAVMPWPFWPEQHLGVYPIESAATKDVIDKEGIGLGDEVFMAGLYTKHAGKGRNNPIIRVGNLAAMPDEPVATGCGLMDAYLVEIRSIGGISGSPVFVRPTLFLNWTGEGSDSKLELRSPFYLLGVMHGRWDMKHLAPIMFEIDADYLKQPLNSGIGVVVPVERIIETLNQPVLARRREEEIAGLQQRDATTAD